MFGDSTALAQPLDRFKKESPGVFSPADKGRGQTAAGPGWTLILGAFTGEDRDERARTQLARLSAQGGFEGARLRSRAKAVVIEFGRFADPSAPEAQAELVRVRSTLIDGQPALERAFFAPPDDAPAGTMPQFDLRRARAGLDANARYTLQVGAYGRDDNKPPTADELAQFRKAAEQAVADLRREGDPAFYFHGPQRSTVTVGLFTDADVTLTPGSSRSVESQRIRELRERYPNNLLNGKGIRETQTGTDGKKVSRMQSSILVEIPKGE